MFHFHCGLVNNQARTDVGYVIDGFQAVRLQRVAGVNNIDDEVSQPDYGTKLH